MPRVGPQIEERRELMIEGVGERLGAVEVELDLAAEVAADPRLGFPEPRGDHVLRRAVARDPVVNARPHAFAQARGRVAEGWPWRVRRHRHARTLLLRARPQIYRRRIGPI